MLNVVVAVDTNPDPSGHGRKRRHHGRRVGVQLGVDGVGVVDVEQHGIGLEDRVELGVFEQTRRGDQPVDVVLAAHRVALGRETRRQSQAVCGKLEFSTVTHPVPLDGSHRTARVTAPARPNNAVALREPFSRP
jgi:hypothetical protein